MQRNHLLTVAIVGAKSSLAARSQARAQNYYMNLVSSVIFFDGAVFNIITVTSLQRQSTFVTGWMRLF